MFLDEILQTFGRHTSRPALFIGGVAHTYADLARRTSAILARLKSLPDHEAFVGVIARDHIDTYASLVAVLLSGRCYVPINPAHPGARNRSVVEQARLRTVLVPEDDGALEVLGAPVEHLVATHGLDGQAALDVPPWSPDSLAYLLFTSGSSGQPKGVPITRGNLDAFLHSFRRGAPPITEEDRILQMFDLTFDFSVVSTYTPLLHGACLYSVPPDVIKFTYIASLLEDEKLTQLPLVPSVLTNLRPYFADLDLSSVSHTYFCGEALHADLLEAFADAAPRSVLANYYGPTEATVFAMLYVWDRVAEKRPRARNGIVSIGRAMEGMSAAVVNEQGQRVADGSQGEIALAGPQLTPGYHDDPERNARSFFSLDDVRHYRTGDVAEIEVDGAFAFVGRVDHQVKVNGYRVELTEIEHHARLLAAPSAAVVVDVRSDAGTRLHLFLEGFRGNTADVVNLLKERVPPYMVPSSVSTLPSLPLNANGKVDRLRLREIATEARTRA